MPNVGIVDGVKIFVYGNDHGRPHFHTLAAEYHAVIDIETMEVIGGRLPRARLRKVLMVGPSLVKQHCWKPGTVHAQASL